jgi:hypothetical protein
MREAGGDALDIIVEMHSNTDTLAAIQIGQAMEDLRIFYYDRARASSECGEFYPDQKTAQHSIASGERIYTRQGYRPFFEKRLLDVIQPDICLCGGLGEAKKICDMGWTYEASVLIHVCVLQSPKPRRCRSRRPSPTFLVHEHHQRALNPDSRATCLYDWQPENGKSRCRICPVLARSLTPETCQVRFVTI